MILLDIGEKCAQYPFKEPCSKRDFRTTYVDPLDYSDKTQRDQLYKLMLELIFLPRE